MKYILNLEMVNMKTSKPNAFYMNSTMFWIEYFKCIGAAGFDAIEMQYNPYSLDPLSFEIGRCGVPVSRFAIEAKYGSIPEFLAMIGQFGLRGIEAVHIDTNEILNEIIAADGDAKEYFPMMDALMEEAVQFCEEARIPWITLTPTPEIGMLERYYYTQAGDDEPGFLERLEKHLEAAREKAETSGVKIAVRNEFWSVLRGEKIVPFLQREACRRLYYSPDMAHLTIAEAEIGRILRSMGNRIACPRFNDTAFADRHENYKRLNAEIPTEGRQRIFCDLGDGTVDLPHWRDELQKLGYDGVVSCESRKTLEVYKGLLKTKWYIDRVLCRK